MSTLLLVSLAACFPSDLSDRDQSIRTEHSAALLDNYEAYETLMSDADTDIVWFDYRMPREATMADVPAKLAARITSRDRCFKSVESRADAVRLRCSDPTNGSFVEYSIRTVAQEHLVLVMYSAINGRVEHEAYGRVIKEFEDEVLARSRGRR
jgi:hypothetical protein